MNPFLALINSISNLTEKAREDLEKHIRKKYYEKDEIIVRDQTVCKEIFYIEQGLVKNYFIGEDRDIIMKFFPEKAVFTVVDSFVTGMPSKYIIQTIEPSIFYSISKKSIDELCQKHHCIETFFRKLLSIAIVEMMKRISELLEEDGTKRYNNFLEENRAIIQRISLGDLAKYLGITQVSLSRIRAKK